MVRPARFGITAAVGNPDHPFSWVALEDLVDALIFIMGKEDISGPVQCNGSGTHHQPGILQGCRRTFPHPPVHPCSGRPSLRLLMGEASQVITNGSAPSGDADAGGI